MAEKVEGNAGRAVCQILGMLAAVIAGVLLAGVVGGGWRLAILAVTVLTICKALWPLQIDVNALLNYEPDD